MLPGRRAPSTRAPVSPVHRVTMFLRKKKPPLAWGLPAWLRSSLLLRGFSPRGDLAEGDRGRLADDALDAGDPDGVIHRRSFVAFARDLTRLTGELDTVEQETAGLFLGQIRARAQRVRLALNRIAGEDRGDGIDAVQREADRRACAVDGDDAFTADKRGRAVQLLLKEQAHGEQFDWIHGIPTFLVRCGTVNVNEKRLIQSAERKTLYTVDIVLPMQSEAGEVGWVFRRGRPLSEALPGG